MSASGLYGVASTQGEKCRSGGDVDTSWGWQHCLCVCREVLGGSQGEEESAVPKNKTGQNWAFAGSNSEARLSFTRD